MGVACSLNKVNTRSLWELAIKATLESGQPLKKPETFKDAYEMYLAEQRFVTVLVHLAESGSSIYHEVALDLRFANLPTALAAWLKPPEADWDWAEHFDPPQLATLNYGLMWRREAKAFLIAAQDFFEIERVPLSTEAYAIQTQEAERCARLLFPD